MEKKEEKLTFSDKLGKWILKNRVALISVLVTLFLVAVICIVAFSVVNKNTEKKYEQLATIETNYVASLTNIDISDDEKATKASEAIAAALELAEANTKNGVGVRAYMLAAEINYKNENFVEAAAAWENAAKANTKAYTAPLSLYNAAACYEEIGNIDAAIENIKKANEYSNFSLKAKAIFDLGRLEETRGDYSAAVNYYNDLITNYSYDEWTKVAKSRVILLQEQGFLN